MAEQIVEAALNENIGIEIDAAILNQLAQPDDIGAMREVQERIAENLLRRIDLDRRHERPSQVPPGT